MARLGLGVQIVLLFMVTAVNGELRTWVDATGQHRVEAELVAVEGEALTLRKTDGGTVRVPIDRLSTEDKKYLEASSASANVAGRGTLNSFAELERLGRQQRDAAFLLNLYEAFLKTPGATEEDLVKVRQALPELKNLADANSIRVGGKWMTPDAYRQAKESEIRLIKEAHRLIDVKNDELARDKFIEASRANPEAVRADFYLGLLNALIAHHAADADDHFSECIKRLTRDEDLLVGTRRANYVAALNNLALISVRKRQYGEAISCWRRALDLAPFTPELVQNLGLISKLAQSGTSLRMGKEHRNNAGNLYAKATVENNLARFDDHVGWLFIPYIDSVDGSLEANGDEEMVTIGWCTGFAVGNEYLVSSRYPLEDADQIKVRSGGNVFEAEVGKIVALSDDSHLAIVRINGLNAKSLPLSSTRPRAGQDVTIAGYPSPGLAADTLQRIPATVLDPPRFFGNVELVVHKQVEPGVNIFIRSRGVRQLLMHDAITRAAVCDSPPLSDSGGGLIYAATTGAYSASNLSGDL